jgi:iron transport multicopper oxidase
MRNRVAKMVVVSITVLTAVTAVAVTTASAGTGPAGAASSSPADGATRGADNYRSGWYPDQAALSPTTVTGGSFGQQFETAVNGSVYGQPLLDDGQVLVTTENDAAYGIDPVSGAVLWSRQFGSPVPSGQLQCSDLPTWGITGTPVVDQSTDTEYVVDFQYVSGTSGPVAYYMHALDLDAHGAERPGFPVQIQGTAANDAQQTFTPALENQRAGLLLLGGVVYAAFSSHCDLGNYQGWIAGVSEAGSLTTMWTDSAQGTSVGAGIWMAGDGLVSDGAATMLFVTGNGISSGDTPSGPLPGTSPPADLGESVVRLHVRPNGTLQAVDFFAPYDAPSLDTNDDDFGSGGLLALPDQYFGTSQIPHLALTVGKEGYVYLLDRDHLGGEGEGPGGTDAVVGRYGPNGAVWSSPSVWPGDGGWIYIPTGAPSGSGAGSSGNLEVYRYGVTSGTPGLTLAGQASSAFGFGSSAPIITSNGTTSGSALVWVVHSPGGGGSGAQLQAYDPVPVNGVLQEVWSAPVGTGSKFNPPGVGDGRIYVGTRDGNLIAFGTNAGLQVTTTSLPGGTSSHPYSTTLGATGGDPPYTWRMVVNSGRLPPGLHLDKPSGTISGTPTKSGTYPFTVEVQDTKSTSKPRLRHTAQASLSITVASG